MPASQGVATPEPALPKPGMLAKRGVLPVLDMAAYKPDAREVEKALGLNRHREAKDGSRPGGQC
jgi:hypothetical protein